jgi:hypothetical protein
MAASEELVKGEGFCVSLFSIVAKVDEFCLEKQRKLKV